ncbi:MAG TPA: DUF4430 domain-containing protein [Firmicutes bacterium]|nr:DUF4430 domain-containing protein [Bacillota bacterium]
MRKTIKKLLAGVLVAVCMTALFAGCVIETPEQAARNAAGNSYSTASSSENSANTSDSSPSESSESSASSTSSEKADKTTSESKADTEKQESASSSSEKSNGSSSEKESASSASSSSKPKATAKPSGGSGSGGNSQSSQPEEDTLTCTLSVTCKTVLDNLEFLDPTRKDCIGDNGVIYAKKTVSFEEGETVFDVLSREMKKNGIHMDFSFSPVYNSRYIKGINNLYEFNCGSGSGWMYRVNGVFPNYGCSQYQVEDGDTIEWLYTCDLGVDLGRNY